MKYFRGNIVRIMVFFNEYLLFIIYDYLVGLFRVFFFFYGWDIRFGGVEIKYF